MTQLGDGGADSRTSLSFTQVKLEPFLSLISYQTLNPVPEGKTLSASLEHARLFAVQHGAAQEHHGMIKLLSAPIRTILRFPLFQFAVVIFVILYLQAADENSARGAIFSGLDKLVGATVDLFSEIFSVKSFTKSWLTSGFMIAYVYLAGLLLLYLARVAIRAVVDFVGRTNAFGLRSVIARERGVVAYQAWLPFEKIRPAHIPRETWEEQFAWPANDQPPYRPFAQRMLLGVAGYIVFLLIIAVVLEIFAPSVLAWLGHVAKGVMG